MDWYWIISWLIAPIGLVLVYRGLQGDASNGRPRCPKCWYDMRGTVPRLVCPECGHDAARNDQLYLTRRRWRPVVLGSVLVCSWLAYLLLELWLLLAKWWS